MDTQRRFYDDIPSEGDSDISDVTDDEGRAFCDVAGLTGVAPAAVSPPFCTPPGSPSRREEMEEGEGKVNVVGNGNGNGNVKKIEEEKESTQGAVAAEAAANDNSKIAVLKAVSGGGAGAPTATATVTANANADANARTMDNAVGRRGGEEDDGTRVGE